MNNKKTITNILKLPTGRLKLTLECGHILIVGDKHNKLNISTFRIGQMIECPEEPIEVTF